MELNEARRQGLLRSSTSPKVLPIWITTWAWSFLNWIWSNQINHTCLSFFECWNALCQLQRIAPNFHWIDKIQLPEGFEHIFGDGWEGRAIAFTPVAMTTCFAYWHISVWENISICPGWSLQDRDQFQEQYRTSTNLYCWMHCKEVARSLILLTDITLTRQSMQYL